MCNAFTNRLMCQNNSQAVENKTHFTLWIERPKLIYSLRHHHTTIWGRGNWHYVKNKLEIDVTLTITYWNLEVRWYVAIKLYSLNVVLILCKLWSFLLAISIWNGSAVSSAFHLSFRTEICSSLCVSSMACVLMGSNLPSLGTQASLATLTESQDKEHHIDWFLMIIGKCSCYC